MLGLKLYCLPHSGASATGYIRWRRKLPAWIDLYPVELPGRGLRINDPLQKDFSKLIEVLATEISHDIHLNPKLPYALFGHSLGALIAFELAHTLVRKGHMPPSSLFASGTAAPTQRKDDEQRFSKAKTDEELMNDLRSLQGTPSDVLANKEIMALTLPVMRADYLLCGGYRYYYNRKRLVCPIHVLAGTKDRATDEQLYAWERETSGEYSLTKFDGGHFFIQQQEDKVLTHIKSILSPLSHLNNHQYA